MQEIKIRGVNDSMGVLLGEICLIWTGIDEDKAKSWGKKIDNKA